MPAQIRTVISLRKTNTLVQSLYSRINAAAELRRGNAFPALPRMKIPAWNVSSACESDEDEPLKKKENMISAYWEGGQNNTMEN
jgi:hypothetical protein